MRKFKDVLRLKLDAKLSHQQIADALGLSKGVSGPRSCGGLGLVQGMDEAALERRLLVGSQKARDYVQRDYGRLHQELRRKGMTLMLLWEEHRADYADRQIDAPALLALPLQRYETARFKTVKVHIDYHVEVERHRYSVPQTLVGQVLKARITTAVVELLHRGQRVASHARNTRVGGSQLRPRTCRPRSARTWNGRRSA